ncbi:hypothetical protein Tco_0272110 [Tanacetum coccineum]
MIQQDLNQIVEDMLVIIKKLLVLEMIVGESLKMIEDESLEIIEDESLDMIVDETLKLDEILSRLSDVVVNLNTSTKINMGGSYKLSFPMLIRFPPGRTAKLRLTPKSPSSGIDLLAPSPNLLTMSIPPQDNHLTNSSCGKRFSRDQNAEDSWALLEDLALYDNESWNNPRDFSKLVKAISLLQDFPSTSDCRLVELEN